MGDIWAGLFVLGFIVPGLFVVGSTVIVVRLARRLRRAIPGQRPPWHYVVSHLALGIGLAIPLGPLAFVAWLLLPGYLYHTLRRSAQPEDSSDPRNSSPLWVPSRRRSWGIAVLFTATGLLLPWAIGLGVKMYLDSLGRPTLPVEGFIDPVSVAVILVLTLGTWAFPFLALASAVVVPWRFGFPADSPARDSLLPIWMAYAAAGIAAIPVYLGIFWEFDSMMLLVPVGIVLIPPMAFGYFVGWWLLRRREPSGEFLSGRRV